ncbi:hypothetical protein V3481_018727 [Fusarium oxysporum f. sp. vasinfectum]|uniref:Uncharacterized protein n=1 Tax=Fusarium oxysporum f. sp. vasinfectum 25433 TaxID=1089449 RepID=X0L518_FUSOX|nr:hypothetical protein FOTG_15606 [Fusarium oxysporum f. sp. vasinfectum 25433]
MTSGPRKASSTLLTSMQIIHTICFLPLRFVHHSTAQAVSRFPLNSIRNIARWLQCCDKTPTEVASEPLTNHDMMAIMKSTTHEKGEGNDDDPCKNDVMKDDWVDETTA